MINQFSDFVVFGLLTFFILLALFIFCKYTYDVRKQQRIDFEYYWLLSRMRK